jgi:hypothetical protein
MNADHLFEYLDLLARVARHELACAELRAFVAECGARALRPPERTPAEADADMPQPARGRSASAWHFWCRGCGWSWRVTPAVAAGRVAVLCCGQPVACFWGGTADLPRPEGKVRPAEDRERSRRPG